MDVDDNGYIEIAGRRVLELTGTHASTTVESTVQLEAGYHYTVVHSENLPVPEEIAGYPNARQFEPKLDGAPLVLFQVEPIEQDLNFIPVRALKSANMADDESGAMNYIDSGSLLKNGKHEIHAGLQYRGSLKDANFSGAIASNRGQSDRFEPHAIAMDANGEAQFELISKDASTNPVVTVNDVSAQSGGLLPAVFKDKFRITVYYTPKESGFTAESISSKTKRIIKFPDGTPLEVEINDAFWKCVVGKFINEQWIGGEGFGLLKNPAIHPKTQELYPYLGYTRKVYKNPLGNRNNRLKGMDDHEAIVSCAGTKEIFGSIPHGLVRVILPDTFPCQQFAVDDTVANEEILGGAHHLDLYGVKTILPKKG